MIPKSQRKRILSRGADPRHYDPDEILGRGSHSLVFRHDEDASLAIKLTCCPAGSLLLRQLQSRAHPDYVQVYHHEELGALAGSELPFHLFVVERLEQPSADKLIVFNELANKAAQQALQPGERPVRGRCGYAAFNVRYCQALADADLERRQGWLYLANHLQDLSDEWRSVDALTEGNLLARRNRLVLSDPLRRVAPRPAL